MRKNLKKLRVDLDLTQAEAAKAMGITSGYFSAVELGKQNGTIDFWNALQTAFNIPDDKMWGLTKDE